MKVYETYESCSHIKAPVYYGDAGYDVSIPVSYTGQIIQPSSYLIIDTGVVIVPEPNHYVRVEPRSSRFKRGLWAHGVVDNGYRGTIKLVLWNLGTEPYILEEGEYVVQLIPTLAVDSQIEYHNGYPTDESSERQENGFGSTDKAKQKE